MALFSKSLNFRRNFRGLLNFRSLSTETEEKSSIEKPVYGTIAEDDPESFLMEREQAIEKLRNKSRLNPSHYNILHGKLPYEEPACDTHLTLLYKKRMFGRYGRSSGLDPGYLWPNKSEIEKKLEYDRIANPYGVMELAAKERGKIEKQEELIRERQQEIVANVKKLEQWKKDVKNRAEYKLAQIAAAKAKKEALIEEVRRHFGFKVDPKDERFKEVLLQKEKDMKKKLKEEKAKLRQEKLLATMQNSPS